MVTATLTDKPMNSLQLMFTWSSLNQACYVLCSCRWVLWWSMFEHGTYPNTWHLTIFWWSLFGTHFSGPVIKFGPFSVPKSLQFGWVKNRFFFFLPLLVMAWIVRVTDEHLEFHEDPMNFENFSPKGPWVSGQMLRCRRRPRPRVGTRHCVSSHWGQTGPVLKEDEWRCLVCFVGFKNANSFFFPKGLQ